MDVEFYLASVCKYKPAGVDRVLDALTTQHPSGHYVYDEADGWFRVRCRAGDEHVVQLLFRDVHTALEEENEKSELLIQPSPNDLLRDSGPDLETMTTAATIADHLCPLSFDQFACSKVWARIEVETPDTISVLSVLSDDDRRAVMAQTGTHMEVDPSLSGRRRLVFVGGATPDAVARACDMLDNLFRKYVYVMPPPKHLLWAESESESESNSDSALQVQVDARYMAHVNDGMLTSSIFDPGQYSSGARLDELFAAVFAKAACLRICFCDRARRIAVSYFGPRAQPVFDDQARTWPTWFKRAEYTPKAKGVTAPPVVGGVDGGKHGGARGEQKHQQEGPSQALDCLSREIDLLTDDLPLEGLESGIDSLAVKPPVFDLNGKHGHQMRLLQEFLVDPYSKDAGGPDVTKAAVDEPLISFDEAPQQSGRNDAKNDKNAKSDDDDLLIDFAPLPAPPPPPVRPVSPRAMVAENRTANSRALVRRTTFTSSLCSHIGRLMGDLAYCRGRIRVQAEIGRIYIMDTIAEGLAQNLPGEAANGWPQSELVSRLDTVCVQPDSVVWTKALTLFANDMERVLGVRPDGGGAGDLVDLGVDADANAAAAAAAAAAAPEWSFHDKRIVYELRCERRVVDSATGVVTVQSPFVVEIDGTMPGAFAYSLRRVDDSRPPVWVHCIRRSWDVRVVVAYSATDALQAEYGAFARELLDSLVVPPGPMTRPRFQVAYGRGGQTTPDGRQTIFTKVQSARVRNVGRFVSSSSSSSGGGGGGGGGGSAVNDGVASGSGASFLDVSWVRHMAMDEREHDVRFTGADDRQADGVFGTWYEASVVSAAAEQAFRENETLAAGACASWGGQNTAVLDSMLEAAFGPALRLVQKMDGVGVLIDNGQGEGKRRMPALKTRAARKFW